MSILMIRYSTDTNELFYHVLYIYFRTVNQREDFKIKFSIKNLDYKNKYVESTPKYGVS